MNLVERHIIKKNNINHNSCDRLCKLSKNLYNQALYEFNKQYQENQHFIRYNDMNKILKDLPDEYNNYKLLTPSVSQQVLMLFDKNVKSFLSLIKLWKKDKKKLKGCPKFLKYKKKDGKNIVVIRGDVNVSKFKDGFIHFPKKLNLQPIKTKKVKEQKDLVQIRIIPKSNHYIIEIVYKVKDIKLKEKGNKAAIDLGINNLATLTVDNGNCKIFNGKPLKSINKYYNKKKSKIQSELILKNEKYVSNKLIEFTNKRNNKINDYLHKMSKLIVDELELNGVNELVIGYNKEWKQKITLGKKTNQTFVSIPYLRIIDMLKYKCTLVGINVITNEESYTSKCDSLAFESIKKQTVYKGKRVKRGLFQSSIGKLLNADINGSLNIGRKVFGDVFIPTDIGFVVNPSIINIQ